MNRQHNCCDLVVVVACVLFDLLPNPILTLLVVASCGAAKIAATIVWINGLVPAAIIPLLVKVAAAIEVSISRSVPISGGMPAVALLGGPSFPLSATSLGVPPILP